MTRRSKALSWLPTLALVAFLAFPGSARAQFEEADVTVLRTFEAESEGDSFGFVSERLGDLDFDGVPELIVGAPANGAGGRLAGRAYVYSGATGEQLHVLTGAAEDRLGYAVAEAGDVDGDGVADYLVGGIGTFEAEVPFRGRVLVVSGNDHRVLHDIEGSGPFSALGYEVAGVGDLDGDGHADFAAGAPFASSGGMRNNGRVRVFSGASGAEIWSREGRFDGGLFGIGLSGLELDLDGDGLREVLGAASGGGPEGSGVARILSGADGRTLRWLVPEETAGSFGWFFAHDAGDVDGDGVHDIYVGDFSDTTLGPGSGRAYVFSGKLHYRVRTGDDRAPAPGFEVARPIVSIPPRQAGEGLGIGRGAGDLDGDGRADLVLGAYTHSGKAEQGGRVYLVRGLDGTVLRTLTGTKPGVQLGFDAIMAGDADQDGVEDILVTGVDVAYLVAGRPLR
jgi:hypothetical protein